MDMMDRFSEKAKKAIELSVEAAQQLGHPYIGSEHLLIGLISEGTGTGAKVMDRLGVTAEGIMAVLESNADDNPGENTPNTPEFTPRSKRIFEQSLAIATQIGSKYVGTDHLFYAIMLETDSMAVRILANMGITSAKMLEEIYKNYNDNNDTHDSHVSKLNDFLNNQQSEKGKKNKKPDSDTPTLDQFGRDLTELAKLGKIDPVIGREHEIERIIQILSRRTKNNPCLIGEPGVGKTAIVEGLAQKIIDGNIPETIKGKRIVTLDLSGMVAGTKYRGEFEERLKKTMDEILKSGNVILFIDEIHTVIGAGAAEGAIDAASILKPTLARGEMQVIGATTLDEYRKHIEKDSALERRFQTVMVGEPSSEDALEILKGLRDKYEAHHRVKITDKSLEAAVTLSERYISDRYLPDKAIDLIDEAASMVRLRNFTAPPDIKELESKQESLSKEKEEAINEQNFEKAAKIRDNLKEINDQIAVLKEEWSKRSNSVTNTVTEDDIGSIVSSWTGIPVKKLAEEESQRLIDLEANLHQRVIGQDDAVKSLAKAIRRGRVGLKDPKRPIGSFIFLGPTGVGKTELTKALAESLFGSENAMIRIDMSEYMEKHNVSRLIGSPPGYVGYDDGGQLTEKIRRKPYSVVLFDEIEKAHPDVFNILLQILEDGILTDSRGRKVSFKNTVIIMTSNVGGRLISDKKKKLGFGDVSEESVEYENIKSNVLNELKRDFRPEFLNRVDEIIVFHQLTKPEIEKIVGIMCANVAKRIAQNDIKLELTLEAISFLANKGFDPAFGARPLRRSIQTLVEDKLAELMLDGELKPGQTLKVGATEDKELKYEIIR